jgi:hypothetical protein
MSDPLSRVHYFEEQYLRTQDFVDEQAYHLTAHRRHNVGQHTWGIVVGLELESEEGALVLRPGVAVDGYGRDLVVPTTRSLPGSAFAERGSDELDVWLVYDRVGTDPAPPGYAGCEEDGDVPYYRWLERPIVRLERPDPAFPDPRLPEVVPPGDRDFDASRPAPDDPLREWPVFLGRVRFDPDNPENPYAIDSSNRPYVGLVGEYVVAPSGRTLLQLGPSSVDDPNVVALYIPEAESAEDRQRPRLAFAATGEVELRGDTTVYGDVALAGRALELRPGDARSPDDGPWRLYHVEDTGDVHELRIEMARPAAGGVAGLNEVVIGSWAKTVDATGAEVEGFRPCLSVSDDCTVTVHGNLVVEGSIVEGVDLVTGGLSDEAARMALAAHLGGVGAAGFLLDRLYRSPATSRQRRVAMTRMAMRAMPNETIRAFSESLAADALRLDEFAHYLRDRYPETARLLRDALEP